MQGLSYVPDFLSRGEEAATIRYIDAAPSGRWVASGERRILVILQSAVPTFAHPVTAGDRTSASPAELWRQARLLVSDGGASL